MNINVFDWALEHFWDELPAGSWEFWSFRFKPPCSVGDELIFRSNKKPIARAVAASIEPPGRSECSSTGRFRSGWKVFWKPESFQDLRYQDKGLLDEAGR